MCNIFHFVTSTDADWQLTEDWLCCNTILLQCSAFNNSWIDSYFTKDWVKTLIPRFIIRIRMRISIRIRKISMRTPYSTFQYPSNVSACVISLSFTLKFNTFYPKCGDSKVFYIRVPLQGYDVLVVDYGFDI